MIKTTTLALLAGLSLSSFQSPDVYGDGFVADTSPRKSLGGPHHKKITGVEGADSGDVDLFPHCAGAQHDLPGAGFTTWRAPCDLHRAGNDLRRS